MTCDPDEAKTSLAGDAHLATGNEPNGAAAAHVASGATAGSHPASQPRIEDVLRTEGVYVSTTVGVSMWPMLRNRRDTIVVRPAAGRLNRYDVALYRAHGNYVLHRVVRVLPEGYIIIGDNCITEEHVEDSQVLGVLSEFYRGDKHVDMAGLPYRAYVWLWVTTAPARHFAKRAKGWLGRRVRGSR